MQKILILASLGALTLTSVAAQADHNWRKRKFVQRDGVVYLYENDDDGFVSYEDDEDDDVIYLNRRQRQMRDAERDVDAELWWLEENARKKFESRAKARNNIVKKVDAKPVLKKSVTKPKAVVAAKKPKSPVAELQTASLSKPAPIAKPKPSIALAKPKTSLPAAKPKAVATKTIGCTAGAAVVTGYGFAEVKPKACTGATYAYTAARSGKNYEIKMTAASGEIVDVKKLN
jgi:hypothetical protein